MNLSKKIVECLKELVHGIKNCFFLHFVNMTVINTSNHGDSYKDHKFRIFLILSPKLNHFVTNDYNKRLVITANFLPKRKKNCKELPLIWRFSFGAMEKKCF